MIRLAITMGDPAGIGPEIVTRALGENAHAGAEVTIYGQRDLLGDLPGDVRVIDVSSVRAKPGEPTLETGAAQVAYLEAALAAAARGKVDALVTAPISKTWAKKAGFAFPGHTELLAERLGAREHAMMFAGPKLRVVLATIHVALADVPKVLTPELVARAAVLGGRATRARRIGVLGLNPHAGEGGLFGREELDVIAPGIELARERLPGVAIEGPLVPDAAYRGAHDLFVAMYHDQGLIPVKLIDFEDAVNVTLGLPIVRTSPDHGVAYDIAGRGIARHRSLSAALRMAIQLTNGTQVDT